MVAFLPDLPGAARLVRWLGCELGEEFAGGEFLQVGHDAREIGGMDDGVEVILYDDPRVEPQPFLPPADS